MKLALIALFLPALLSGQSEYRGKLAPELAVEAESLDSIDFRLATAQEKERLGEITSRVFAGQIAGAPAFLVDGDKPFLYVEMGSLRKFPLKPERDRHFFGSIPDCAEIRFPLPGPAYKEFPVRVCVPPVPEKTESRTVWQWRTLIAAAVRIGGQDLSFAFEYDRAQNRALPDNGLQMYGVQRMILKDERPVYRSGDAYFSVRSIDTAHRTFILDARAARDYTRFDFLIGETFADFAFTDLEGGSHKLSDYSGKPVLLDFWATWCRPCVAQLPRLRELSEHGLQIIGMNVDEDPEAPRAMNLPWVQASRASIREVLERRCRIQSFPTYLLLDGDRRLIAVGEQALRQ